MAPAPSSPPGATARQRRSRAVARWVAPALALTLAGCGNSGDEAHPAPPVRPLPATTTVALTATGTSEPATAPTAPPETTTTLPAPPTTSDPSAGPPAWDPFEVDPIVAGGNALTGLPLPPGVDPATPVLAVKVDNHPRSRPQLALERADVVFEENVEGVTRFIALFVSDQPEAIGPVRSARTSDLPVLAGLNRPILAWSGGNDYVTRSVANAAASGVLIDLGEPGLAHCYFRGRGRSAPHNLYAEPDCLRRTAIGAGPATPLWSFGPVPPELGPQPIPSFTVAMEDLPVGWTWDPAQGRYLRSQAGSAHRVASGERLGAVNVVVMTVAYVPSPADHRSPEAASLGSGPAVVHRNGIAIAGTWERHRLDDGYTLRHPSGAVIPLEPGTTFVELAAP